jgi:hypothetical protein
MQKLCWRDLINYYVWLQQVDRGKDYQLIPIFKKKCTRLYTLIHAL